MKPKIIQQLKLWKDNPARKPLILLGARQVGKTWVMKHFGQTEFEECSLQSCGNGLAPYLGIALREKVDSFPVGKSKCNASISVGF